MMGRDVGLCVEREVVGVIDGASYHIKHLGLWGLEDHRCHYRGHLTAYQSVRHLVTSLGLENCHIGQMVLPEVLTKQVMDSIVTSEVV